MWLILKDNYLLNLKKADDQYNFYLTNLVHTWNCQLTISDVIKKFKELNPMFEMKESAIIEKISALFCKQCHEDCHQVQKLLDGNIRLKSSNAIKGFTYEMDIVLEPAKQEIFFNEFTTPLIQLLYNFKEREKELATILEAKDVELEEYRLEGVEIKRRNIITAPFCYETFLKTDIKMDDRQPIDLLRGPLQELIGLPTPSPETADEEIVIQAVTKKTPSRVVADVKSISGTAGCLYSNTADSVKRENPRKRKIPTRTLKL